MKKILSILGLGISLFSCSDNSVKKVIETPVACFTTQSLFSEILIGDEVTFKNCSENAVSYKWDFGDGITSIQEGPSHSYSNVGTYNVLLEVTGEGGTEILSEDVIIVDEIGSNEGLLSVSGEGSRLLSNGYFENGVSDNEHRLYLYGDGFDFDPAFFGFKIRGTGPVLWFEILWTSGPNQIVGSYEISDTSFPRGNQEGLSDNVVYNNIFVWLNTRFPNIDGTNLGCWGGSASEGFILEITKFKDIYTIVGFFRCKYITTFRYRGTLDCVSDINGEEGILC